MSKKIRIPIKERSSDQHIPIITAKRIPSEKRCCAIKFERTEFAITSAPIARIGEKSMFPMRRKPNFLKSPMYGSQIAVITCPNFVNLAPGNHDIRM